MSVPFEPNPSGITTRADQPLADPVGRVFAFLAGLIFLAFGALISLGTVLVGAASFGIATLVWRKRGRRLSRVGGWLTSIAAVAIVFAAVALIVVAIVPASTWSQVKVSMDSASAVQAKAPPPAWVERMYPGMSQRSAQFQPSAQTQSVFLTAGIGLMGAMFAAIYGSLGWAAGMLLGFGARGRWPGAQGAVPPPAMNA